MTVKIVINACHGGFSISRPALHRLREMGNEVARAEVDVGEQYPGGEVRKRVLAFDSFLRDIPRDDQQLIAVVEELGDKANGMCADLKIVEIPDHVEWVIEEYDGLEWVAEVHRTWS